MRNSLRTFVAILLLAAAAAPCLGQSTPPDVAALHRDIERHIKSARFGEAEKVAQRLVVQTRERAGEQSELHIGALNRLADAYWELQRFLDARQVYELILNLSDITFGPDHLKVAKALTDLAAAVGSDRAADAIPLLERALAIRERQFGPDDPRVANSLLNLANALVSLPGNSQQRLERAERDYRRILSILEKAGRPEDVVAHEVKRHLAELYFETERPQEGEQLLRQLYDTHMRSGRPGHANGMKVELAKHYFSLGRWREAEQLEKELLAWAAKNDPNGLIHAGALGGLGAIYNQHGRQDDAAELFERSLVMLTRKLGPDSLELKSLLHELGLVHLAAGRPAEAERLLARATALAERSDGADSSSYSHSLWQLAVAQRDQGKLDAAMATAKRRLAIEERIYGADGGITGQALDLTASIHAAAGRHAEARDLYRKATGLIEKSVGRGHIVTMASLRDLAATECAAGDFASSLPLAREVAAYFAGRRQRSGGLGRRDVDSRETYAEGAFSTLVCAAYGMSEQAPREREALASEGLVAAQRDREGRAEAAVTQMAARMGAADPKLAEAVRRQQDLADRLQALDKQLIEVLSGAVSSANGKRPATADTIRRQQAETERQLAAAIARIVSIDPGFAAFANPQPLDIAGVRQHLQDDEVMVAFMTGKSASWVWAVSRTGVAWQRVPQGASQLKDAVAALRRPLDDWAKSPRGLERLGTDEIACAPPAVADLRGLNRLGGACGDDRRFSPARAHELYRTLLGPVETLIRDRRHLIIVPSGPLTALPFGVLTTEPTAGAADLKSFAAAPWLIRRHAITVLPSVASLKALRTGVTVSRAPQPFLGIGDPAFSGGAPARGAAPTRVAEVRGFASYYRGGQADPAALKQSLAPLPDTADELRAIARTLGAAEADLLLGRNASERRLKGLNQAGRLADYRVIAFATHGLVAGEVKGLAEPAIALTIPQTTSEDDDGLLTASEAARFKLDADWVVLSACNTAAGGQPGAEALSGLARAFFYAGARALLVSHWPVASDAAVKLTTRSFEALAADSAMGRAEALRRAMLTLIEKGAPHEAHPAYWAPFIVVGEGGAQR